MQTVWAGKDDNVLQRAFVVKKVTLSLLPTRLVSRKGCLSSTDTQHLEVAMGSLVQRFEMACQQLMEQEQLYGYEARITLG